MVYAKEAINGAALVICPKCRGVCPGKFECEKIKQYIDTFIEEIVKEKKNYD